MNIPNKSNEYSNSGRGGAHMSQNTRIHVSCLIVYNFKF